MGKVNNINKGVWRLDCNTFTVLLFSVLSCLQVHDTVEDLIKFHKNNAIEVTKNQTSGNVKLGNSPAK